MQQRRSGGAAAWQLVTISPRPDGSRPDGLLQTREAALATMWAVPGLSPAAGDVKAGKTLRKQQQLSALCRLVLRLAQPGSVTWELLETDIDCG